MAKELIISIIIVVLIFIGNTITENYTRESIDETTNNLESLREEIKKGEDEVDENIAKEKIDKIHEQWNSRYEKLAYYIEHDELEKVKTELTGLRGYIEKEEYSEAIPELDKSVYILEHITDKTALNLKKIFYKEGFGVVAP